MKYHVDMKLGVCSCPAGQDGSPCSHQAAVVKHFHIPSVNCIPTLSPETRQLLAKIAVGSAAKNAMFYSSLHQKNTDATATVASESETADFTGTAWNLVRSGEVDEADTTTDIGSRSVGVVDIENLTKQIQEFTEDITARVKENSVVAQGMHTFLTRYQNLTSGTFQNARLSSALHRFGWVFGGTIRRTQGGHMRRGRRIPVSAKAAGRRRKAVSRGKAKLPPGRPKGMKLAEYPPSRFHLPNRREPPGKRAHSLHSSITLGTQNGGKW